MGTIPIGSNIQSSLVNVTLQIPRSIYYPGETISGQIHLTGKPGVHLPMSIMNPQINVEVIEKEYWQRHDSLLNEEKYMNCSPEMLPKEGQIPEDMKHQIVGNVISTQLTLPMNTLQAIQSGQGCFIPFQIQLPGNIKPSVEHFYSITNYGYSRKYLKVSIPSFFSEFHCFLWVLKQSMPLNESLNHKIVCEKRKLGIFKEGSVTLTADFVGKNSFFFGENCVIHVMMDATESKVGVREVNVALKRTVKYMINGGNKYISDGTEIKDTLWTQKYPVTKKIVEMDVNMPIKESEDVYKNYKSDFPYLNSLNREHLIAGLPSYKGMNIEIKYYIKVKAVLDSMLMGNAELYMNLDVYHWNNDMNSQNIIQTLSQGTNFVNGYTVNLNYPGGSSLPVYPGQGQQSKGGQFGNNYGCNNQGMNQGPMFGPQGEQGQMYGPPMNQGQGNSNMYNQGFNNNNQGFNNNNNNNMNNYQNNQYGQMNNYGGNYSGNMGGEQFNNMNNQGSNQFNNNMDNNNNQFNNMGNNNQFCNNPYNNMNNQFNNMGNNDQFNKPNPNSNPYNNNNVGNTSGQNYENNNPGGAAPTFENKSSSGNINYPSF